MTQQTEITKEQILKDLKSKLREYENKRENLRYERYQISFSIKNCDQLDYTFEMIIVLLLFDTLYAYLHIEGFIFFVVNYKNMLVMRCYCSL